MTKAKPDFCCRKMEANATHWKQVCDHEGHENEPCPDRLIAVHGIGGEEGQGDEGGWVDDYGIVQDGHWETVSIKFCPWCGQDLISFGKTPRPDYLSRFAGAN